MARERSKSSKVKKKGINTKLIIGIIASIIVVGFGIYFLVDYLNTKAMRDTLDTDTIYPNILVNTINIGGMKKEDAIKKLEQDLQEPFSKNKVTFIIDGNEEEIDFTYGQFGVKYDIEAAVDKAYNYAREEGTIKERYELYERLKANEFYTFEAQFLNDKGHLPDEVIENIKNELSKNLKDKVYIAPKNATVKKNGSNFTVTPDENGRELDLDRAVDIVVEFIEVNSKQGEVAIHTPTKEIQTPTKEVAAKVTTEQAKQVGDKIGSYSTKYRGSGSSGRVTNMRVAASRMNGTVINPGETFSTNKCFGESTPQNGYKLAGAYINGELSQDYGGGVCQVSTTLYNAVLRAELEVVERRNHSLTVGYVPRGFDATLAGDYIDFKFKNDTNVPVYIESYVTSNQVVVELYGKEIHSANRTLEFKSKLSGRTYKTYKEVFENGKFVEEVYLSSSTYKNSKGSSSSGTSTNNNTTNANAATNSNNTTDSTNSTDSTNTNNSETGSNTSNSNTTNNSSNNNSSNSNSSASNNKNNNAQASGSTSGASSGSAASTNSNTSKTEAAKTEKPKTEKPKTDSSSIAVTEPI